MTQKVEQKGKATYCGWTLGSGMKVLPKQKWPANCKSVGCEGRFFDGMKPKCALYSPVSEDKVRLE